MEAYKNNHTIFSLKKQVKNGKLSESQIKEKLTKTFFNPEWTENEVYDAVNQAYIAATKIAFHTGIIFLNIHIKTKL